MYEASALILTLAFVFGRKTLTTCTVSLVQSIVGLIRKF